MVFLEVVETLEMYKRTKTNVQIKQSQQPDSHPVLIARNCTTSNQSEDYPYKTPNYAGQFKFYLNIYILSSTNKI